MSIAEGEFSAQRAKIEKDLADGKTYVEIAPEDRARVRQSLERMAATLEGVASVDELSQPQKVALFNEQEVVNTILTQAAEDSRLICERRRETGSHRATTTCETVAERRRRREDDQRRLQTMQRAVMPDRNN
ncbi:hypothetical protein F0415_05000 [Arenimonas fontis]|uniref:Uncharacterized protein n=1 Tax=Arenimonas fontis TaxID=2608255 RepID=A0A5B2ZBM5_9GAMM|nr:hypothetical protein F0415_05000 [Arenimonas fontis]